MRKLFSFLLALSFVLQVPTVAWGQQTRFEQLLHLQHQAQHHVQNTPYSRDLLFYISALLLYAHMHKFSAYEFKMALTQELSQFSSSAQPRRPEFSFRHMYAQKTRPVASDVQLSLFPDEPAPAKPAPAKKEDLSWLDKEPETLKPTKKPQKTTLFAEIEPPAQPIKKSYLSRRIEEKYKHTSFFFKLTQEEIEGLFQRLNQASAINYKYGKDAAYKFLSEMADKYPKAQVLFLQAKHLLLGGVLLFAIDQLLDLSFEDPSFSRLARNPYLFINASEQELKLLAENPQSLPYAQLLVSSLEELAATSVSQEEIEYIRAVNHSFRQSTTSPALRQGVRY